MKQEGLKSFPLTDMTLLGLVLFFVVFVGLLFWVRRKSAKKIYQDMANLPLNGKTSSENQGV